MRIAWVRAGRILPPNSGGRIRSVRLAQELARSHGVVVVNPYRGPERDLRYEALLRESFPGSEAHYLGPEWRWDGWRSGLRTLRPSPELHRVYRSARVRARLSDLVERGSFDAVVCDALQSATSLPSDLPIPLVLSEHNVEFALCRSQARRAESVRQGVALRAEAEKVRRLERSWLRRAALVVAVSGNDAAALSRLGGSSRVVVVPNGVDPDVFVPAQPAASRAHLVVFLGLMDYLPNVDAVAWFCEAIWDRVRASVPSATFRIVGHAPSPRVQALASASVEITGGVDSVVPHLQAASLVVVPLRAGSGTRLKILEAMATACPVVSTTLGAEGIPVTNGVDALVEDDPEGFARAVIRLLEHPEEAEEVGRAGRRLALGFSWEASGRLFDDFLSSI